MSYIVLQDLLGDLIPKGEKCVSKQGMFSNKGGEMFSQEGKVYSKEGDIPSESSHEGEVAKKGENQRGNHGFRGRPSHHWMVVSIQASVSGFSWFQLVSSG